MKCSYQKIFLHNCLILGLYFYPEAMWWTNFKVLQLHYSKIKHLNWLKLVTWSSQSECFISAYLKFVFGIGSWLAGFELGSSGCKERYYNQCSCFSISIVFQKIWWVNLPSIWALRPIHFKHQWDSNWDRQNTRQESWPADQQHPKNFDSSELKINRN